MADQTVQYIDHLARALMPEAAFQALHHNPRTTMKSMRDYCLSLKNGFPEGDTNAEFRARLEVVVRRVEARHSIGPTEWYRIVAEALAEVPLRQSA